MMYIAMFLGCFVVTAIGMGVVFLALAFIECAVALRKDAKDPQQEHTKAHRDQGED